MGSILAMAITGLLLKTEGKWPSVFYFFGMHNVLSAAVYLAGYKGPYYYPY